MLDSTRETSEPRAETAAAPLNERSRAHVVSELKSDFRFTLFYLLPRLRPGRDWPALAAEIGLEEKLAATFVDALYGAGLWTKVNGEIQVDKDQIELGDLQISEFLSMSVGLLARMHAEGPCWYETLFVVTSDRAKKEFYRKVNQALKELVAESGKPGDDLILAWNHSGLDCLKAMQREQEEKA